MGRLNGLSLALTIAVTPAAAVPPNRLVLIGDSHVVGAFGKRLDYRLRAADKRRLVDVHASCGAEPSWSLPDRPDGGRVSHCGTWTKRHLELPPYAVEESTEPRSTPRIAELLRPGAPTTVIVALGTNMADWKIAALKPDLAAAGDLARAIAASGARCIWIGPPDARGELDADTARRLWIRLDESLRAEVAFSCSYLTSRTIYEGRDGIHYAPAAARAWADQVHASLVPLLPRMRPAPLARGSGLSPRIGRLLLK